MMHVNGNIQGWRHREQGAQAPPLWEEEAKRPINNYFMKYVFMWRYTLI